MEIEKLQIQIEANASQLQSGTQEAIKALKNLQKVYDSITKKLKATSPKDKDWLGLASAKSQLESLRRDLYGLKNMNRNFESAKIDIASVDAPSINKAIKEALSQLDLSSVDFRDVIKDIDINPQDIAQPVGEAINKTDDLGTAAEKTTESFKDIRNQVNEILKLYSIQNTDKNGFLSKGSIDTSLASVDQLKDAYVSLSNYMKTVPDSLRTNRMVSGLEEVKSAIMEGIPAADQLKLRFQDIFSSFSSSPIINALKNVGQFAKRALQPALNLLKKMTASIIEVSKRWSSIGKNNGFVDSLKKAALALVGIGGMFGAIRKAAQTWINQNDQISEKINGIWYALGSLLAPAIQFIVNLFERLLATINAVLRSIGLAGISMKGFGKATGSAAKEMKQLASFDEINNLNKNEDSGGGGGAGAGLDLSKKFKLPDVSWLSDLLDKLISWLPLFQQLMEKAAAAINNFTDWLLKSFEYVDKFGVSVKQKMATLAEGIADGFNRLVELINWTQLGQAIGAGLDLALQFAVSFMERFNFKALGQGLANAFNGLVEKIDFGNLGRLLVSKFNALTDLITGAVGNLNWSQLAEKIIEGIRSAVENIKLEEAFKNLSDIISNLITFLSNVISEIDWNELGNKIGDSINNIDWVGIIVGAVDLITTIAGALAEMLTSAFNTIDIWTIINGFVQGMLEVIKNVVTDGIPILISVGGSIVTGLLEGMYGVIEGVYQWLKSNIFDPIVNGIKALFGIASPSTVMKAIGEDLVNGLFEGVKNVWEKIKAPFENIGKNISETWTNIKTSASKKWSEIKESVSGVAGKIKEGVTTKWDSIKSNTSTAFSNVKSTMSNSWQGMAASVKTYCTTIVSTVSNMVSAVTSLIGQIRSSVTSLDGLLSSMSAKSFNFSFTGLPSFDVGTNYVPHDMIAQIHKGEAIIPAKYNNGSFGSNEETNSLLRELINLIDSKDMNLTISQNDIGRSAVKFINQQSRINGGALI